MKKLNCECCILGAGPAGLGVAWELVRHGVSDIIIVDRNKRVGGLARTEEFAGNRFDVGPHRFYTKNREINSLWRQVLGGDFLSVKRLTRIYYRNKFFSYPVKPFEALIKLGVKDAWLVLWSFLQTQAFNNGQPYTFEEWVTQKFGRKLYETFFKTYTEKVWGIPCSQIGVEWAAQRIKGLDFLQVLKRAFVKRSQIKALVNEFDYPRLGAGQMYEAMLGRILTRGPKVLLQHQVKQINLIGNRIESVEVASPADGKITIIAKQFFSSIPITHFFQMIRPYESQEVRQAASDLFYREHVTVNLAIKSKNIFPDQWIYVHSPEVKLARIANYNNFSQAMAADDRLTALSVEYFTFQSEALWQMTDEEIKALAVEELVKLDIIKPYQLEAAWLVRETESYPTYYLGFREPYNILKKRLQELVNIYPIGRGGMYKYNNQDHSTYSGLLAARNYLNLTEKKYDLWQINIDSKYLEAGERLMG